MRRRPAERRTERNTAAFSGTAGVLFEGPAMLLKYFRAGFGAVAHLLLKLRWNRLPAVEAVSVDAGLTMMKKYGLIV